MTQFYGTISRMVSRCPICGRSIRRGVPIFRTSRGSGASSRWGPWAHDECREPQPLLIRRIKAAQAKRDILGKKIHK